MPSRSGNVLWIFILRTQLISPRDPLALQHYQVQIRDIHIRKQGILDWKDFGVDASCSAFLSVCPLSFWHVSLYSGASCCPIVFIRLHPCLFITLTPKKNSTWSTPTFWPISCYWFSLDKSVWIKKEFWQQETFCPVVCVLPKAKIKHFNGNLS